MRALLILGAGLVLFTGGWVIGQDDAAAVKKEKELLKGTWKIEKFESSQGNKDDFVDATLTFAGDNVEFTKGGDTKKATYTINPAGKPKEIDIKPEGKDEAMPGIYRIEKDTLTVCIGDGQGAVRPTAFKAEEKNAVVTLKKVKQ